MNIYWCNVAQTIQRDLNINMQATQAYSQRKIPYTLLLADTAPTEIETMIRNLENKTSRGIHGFTVKLLKASPASSLIHLSVLVNKCFQEGTFQTN